MRGLIPHLRVFKYPLRCFKRCAGFIVPRTGADLSSLSRWADLLAIVLRALYIFSPAKPMALTFDPPPIVLRALDGYQPSSELLDELTG